jgi:hypothetical protein
MALTQPTVYSAHFEELRQQPRVIRNWRSGYSGPVKTVQNSPMPIRIMQTGYCTVDQIAGILAGRGDPTQLVLALNCHNIGKSFGSCWMVDSGVSGEPSAQTDVSAAAKVYCSYWIEWEQDYYQAPTYYP